MFFFSSLTYRLRFHEVSHVIFVLICPKFSKFHGRISLGRQIHGVIAFSGISPQGSRLSFYTYFFYMANCRHGNDSQDKIRKRNVRMEIVGWNGWYYPKGFRRFSIFWFLPFLDLPDGTRAAFASRAYFTGQMACGQQ